MAKLGEEQVLQDVFLIDGGKGSADLDSEVGRSAGGQRLLRHFRTSANYAISASGPGNKKRFYTLDVHAKRFCLLRSPLTNLARRVDILVIPRWQFGFAILSWTGSVMFNRELRLHCKKELQPMDWFLIRTTTKDVYNFSKGRRNQRLLAKH
eukprot:m.286222 g.286222  ORF g.286222 m.286222 type:complete len:152 (+) comp16349_c0_seq7:1412-1867(+)